ncbi:hypothetical protein [Dyadobacter frigoris]|uniref:Uncharacterized protein n=1 Tax=Dyadobacter frigoris TaxID=2576211 RepID=A0A4V6BK19_9BACT|nr:hypothetical protein [Dyadobacter frigoris]TKT85743.1 hypothetical protein FDK13_33460 [Dyadobacter frigoris]
MNQKNFEYLKDQVKYSGFGESLENDLKANLQKKAPEFTLQHQTAFGKDQVNSELHFKRSTQSDLYFLNSYQAELKKENQKEALKQTFYVNKQGGNVTLKEAYNLMDGRAVNKDLTNKEGKKFNAWLQMDFKQTENNGNFKIKQFHQKYGFELDKALEKLPIKELGVEFDKRKLTESLQKGNRQVVTFEKDGVEKKHFIQAAPQFKSITVYDENMKRIANRQEKSENQQQTARQDQSVKKEDQKQTVSQQNEASENSQYKGKKASQSKGMSVG